MREVVICNSPAEVGQTAATILLEGVQTHPPDSRYTLALSGGSTPGFMYQSLLEASGAGRLLAEKAEIFFSDERAVPPDSSQSNYRAASVGLFEPLDLPSGIIHRLKGEASDLQAEAVRYDELIRKTVKPGETGRPSFDLILLGMGSDGHTASLFPDSRASEDADVLVQALFAPSVSAWRLTFTLALINSARLAVFMVTGADKAEAVKKALSADINGYTLPAAQVKAARTIWLLDKAAAGQTGRT